MADEGDEMIGSRGFFPDVTQQCAGAVDNSLEVSQKIGLSWARRLGGHGDLVDQMQLDEIQQLGQLRGQDRGIRCNGERGTGQTEATTTGQDALSMVDRGLGSLGLASPG